MWMFGEREKIFWLRGGFKSPGKCRASGRELMKVGYNSNCLVLCRYSVCVQLFHQ